MIRATFKNKPLFIPFIMAGYPDLETTIKALLVLQEKGADMIEVGAPFSDPIADGPTNLVACTHALKHGTTLDKVLSTIEIARNQGLRVPIILFSYFNPILAMGLELLTSRAIECGVQGLLVVDLPAHMYQSECNILKQRLEIILLASPTSDPERLKSYAVIDPAFVYYISRLGTTGAQKKLECHLEGQVAKIKSLLPNLPVVVGFGISNGEQAQSVASFSDGVVVGSALVQTMNENSLQRFSELATRIKKAICNLEYNHQWQS